MSVEIYPTEPAPAYLSGMVDKSGNEGRRRLADAVAALQAALGNAAAALVQGEDDAERQAKAISAVARATRDVCDLETMLRALPQEEDAEAVRAEFRRRLAEAVIGDGLGEPADVYAAFSVDGDPR